MERLVLRLCPGLQGEGARLAEPIHVHGGRREQGKGCGDCARADDIAVHLKHLDATARIPLVVVAQQQHNGDRQDDEQQ